MKSLPDINIAVIDYGAGNLYSVLGALKRAGVNAFVADTPSGLSGVDGIILPGVGAFGYAADMLKEKGFYKAITNSVNAGVPLLGICLGMQLLFSYSEESPRAKGLGLLEGDVTLLKTGSLKTPHMGWSSLHGLNGELLNGVKEGDYVYFVHSYGVHSNGNAVAYADYGERFDAAVSSKNVFGVQFHPEKSSAVGALILNNFLKFCQNS